MNFIFNDIEEHFKSGFMREYQAAYKKNNNLHFSSAEELREFYEDGVAILNWFKKKRSRYFSKKGTYLVGCEIPIVIAPNKMLNNVLYMGYLDVVTYHEETETFKIIDIKTSTKGWNDYAKKVKEDKKEFLVIELNYEVRAPFFHNVEFVLTFKNSQRIYSGVI